MTEHINSKDLSRYTSEDEIAQTIESDFATYSPELLAVGVTRDQIERAKEAAVKRLVEEYQASPNPLAELARILDQAVRTPEEKTFVESTKKYMDRIREGWLIGILRDRYVVLLGIMGQDGWDASLVDTSPIYAERLQFTERILNGVGILADDETLSEFKEKVRSSGDISRGLFKVNSRTEQDTVEGIPTRWNGVTIDIRFGDSGISLMGGRMALGIAADFSLEAVQRSIRSNK